jgi:glycosyltransferase involved in cell wall biosynthesis
MRIAIVHPWFLANGGAEQTVNVLAAMYPGADVFTLFYREEDLPSNLAGRSITALSWNWLPAKYWLFRYLLPLYPLAFESLDLRGYDLILSSDSCVTKCILADQGAVHVCYCHSPMRCLWDLRREFRESLPAIARSVFALCSHYVRHCDFAAAQRVDAFVANSKNVAERIESFYRRESRLLYPPVDTHRGYIADETEDYYLFVGRLVQTKRIDLLIAACNALRRKLVIVGCGREEKRLKAISGPTIEFTGRVSDERLGELYARCKAFLFAADEDFGIVPVEAQSFGRPVIAYGHGGSLETVVGAGRSLDGFSTGLFFREQTAESVMEAIQEFERVQDMFNPIEIQKHAARFDTQNFVNELESIVEEAMDRSGSANRDWATSVRLTHGVTVKDGSGLALASVQRRAKGA